MTQLCPGGEKLLVDTRLELEKLTPKELFYQKYWEALDLVVNFIRQRFDQPGYGVYRHLEVLLLKAARCEDYTTDFKFVVKFYGVISTLHL